MSFAAVVAGTVSIGTSIGGAVAKNSLAKKQKKEADKLRQSTNDIKANPINQVYNDNKAIAETKAINGLAGKELVKQQLLDSNVNSFNKSKLATNSSGDLLSSISAQNQNTNKSLLDLGVSDAEAKSRGLDSVMQQNLNIGAEKARLEAIAEQKRQNIRRQANALEGASTENESAATQELIGGIGSAVGGVVGGINAQSQDKKDKEFWSNLLGSNNVKKDELVTTNKTDNTPFIPAQNFEGMTDDERTQIELQASSKKRKGFEDAVVNPIEDFMYTNPIPLYKKSKKKK